jgi:3-oxoacyl-[acyl-carrier protein] reductase
MGSGRRTVLVTGGARGIGRAIAAAFVRAGELVIIGDILEDEARTTGSALGCLAYVLDVRSSTMVEQQITAIESEHGGIDVLVNNAGVMSRLSVAETPREEWDRIIDTNLDGVFTCCHAVIAGMLKRRRGWIINIGSIWSTHAWPNRAAYAASKAAIEQFTRCFALEVAPSGVLVNSISPGIMLSDMTKHVVDDEKFRASFMPRVSTGRVGDPDAHLADLAVFLASPAAGYMSGEVVEVHGGYY